MCAAPDGRAVDTADTASPQMISLRLPMRSDRYPLGITAETLPTANVASARPATRGPRSSTSTTNSGTSATRRPSADHPVEKFENNAARYARLRSATRRAMAGSVSTSDAASDECRSRTNTTAAAISRATP